MKSFDKLQSDTIVNKLKMIINIIKIFSFI